jgi:hypothetical protein
MRALLVGDASSIHVYNFIKYTLMEMDIDEIVIFNFRGKIEKGADEFQNYYTDHGIKVIPEKEEFGNNLDNIIYSYSIIRELGRFDVCHINFLDYYAVAMGKLLRHQCGIVIANYWGSDWFRSSDALKKHQAELLRAADYVVTDSLQLKDELNRYFQGEFAKKTRYIRYKLPVIEILKKGQLDSRMQEDFCSKYKIPENKIVITCGYSGVRGHKHLLIIEALKNIPLELQNKIFVVFPMTYGKDDDYMENVNNNLRNVHFEYIILENYMSFKEIALLRKNTDIFVDMQPSDAYSSTTLEYTFCNTIIINGSWLDYSQLEEKGAYYEKAADYSELTSLLCDYISHKDEKQKSFCRNHLAVDQFQSKYDDNFLWMQLYEKPDKDNEKKYILPTKKTLMEVCVHDNHQIMTDQRNIQILSRLTRIDHIEDRIQSWLCQENIKDVSIYGAGILGETIYQKIKGFVPGNIYIFDKNERSVEWYAESVLFPNQLLEVESDIAIVTPSLYMKKIKEKYEGKVSYNILTLEEWIEVLEILVKGRTDHK